MNAIFFLALHHKEASLNTRFLAQWQVCSCFSTVHVLSSWFIRALTRPHPLPAEIFTPPAASISSLIIMCLVAIALIMWFLLTRCIQFSNRLSVDGVCWGWHNPWTRRGGIMLKNSYDCFYRKLIENGTMHEHHRFLAMILPSLSFNLIYNQSIHLVFPRTIRYSVVFPIFVCL